MIYINATPEQRQMVITWREIAYSLRRQFMGHAQREAMMITLWNMIDRALRHEPESSFKTSCQALQAILTYATANKSLTHTGRKTCLQLFEVVCQQCIQDWYKPESSKHRTDAFKPFIDDLIDDIPL